MKHLLLALILINSSLVCMDEVELIDSEEKKQETALIKSKQSTCASFQKKLRYYASPSTWKKIGFGGCAFILLAGLGTSLYFIVATDDVSDSNGGFTPPPCNQVPWNRLDVPCQAENFTSLYFVSECQLHAMNVKSPSCVPICAENDTYPWVFSGYDEFVNATACTLDKNMRGQNSFVSCPEKENKAWYQKLLSSLRGQDTPYCEYSYAYGSRGLLIPREHIAAAVTMSRYEEVAEDPSLISESSYCREAVTAAHGSFEGCTGPIVQNDTHTNSTHAAPQSSQKARKRTRKSSSKNKHK